VTSDERLATLYGFITEAGVQALVMAGHAVRFYGVERTTVDYDLHVHLEADAWDKLPDSSQAC